MLSSVIMACKIDGIINCDDAESVQSSGRRIGVVKLGISVFSSVVTDK